MRVGGVPVCRNFPRATRGLDLTRSQGCNDNRTQNNYVPAHPAAGAFCFPGLGVLMRPCRGDGMLTTAESAALVRVSPATIRSWRKRGWLVPQGLDERGHPLHTREAVRAAERRVQANGIQASGIDPRQLRRHHGEAA